MKATTTLVVIAISPYRVLSTKKTSLMNNMLKILISPKLSQNCPSKISSMNKKKHITGRITVHNQQAERERAYLFA